MPVPPPSPTPALFDPLPLRDLKLTFKTADWLATLADAGDDQDTEADLEVDGVVYPRVGVRIKGFTSAKAPGRKKPLNVSMDAFTPRQRLYGYDTFNLNNGYSDPTMVREVVALGALRPFVPSQQATFARVHVNGSYLGLYALTEQVDKTFLRAWFDDPDGILIKADDPVPFGPTPTATPAGTPPPADITRRSNLTWLGEDLAAYRKHYEAKSTVAGDSGLMALRELIRLLAAPVGAGGLADSAFEARIGSVLDVDAALWYLAANNVFMNYDSYYFGHNYFLYQAPGDRRFRPLLWDLNTVFGAFPLQGSVWGAPVAQVHPLALSTDSNRPLIKRLLAVPRFKADYLDHYATLTRQAFNVPALMQAVKDRRVQIREAVYADPSLLYDLDRYERNLTETVQISLSQPNGMPGGQSRNIEGLMPAISARAQWLAGQRDLERPMSRLRDRTERVTPLAAADRVAIALTFEEVEPEAVALVARIDSALPRSISMTMRDGAWQAALPDVPLGSVATYYARAAYGQAKAMFFPAANLTQAWRFVAGAGDRQPLPSGRLVLNELMADNEHTLADPAGDFDDWIELVNRGDQPVRLDGYYLSDDPAKPFAYALPDQVLVPGERLLVWCDDDQDQGPTHGPFKLDKAGETVLLTTRDGIADQARFEALEADVSRARLRDGFGEWVACAHPSPGGLNTCLPAPAGPTPTPWSTRGPTPIWTVAPSSTATPSPTGTQMPTATATPTSTDLPTATPIAYGRHAWLPALTK